MRRLILIIFLLSSTSIFSQNIVTDTIFHKVERKETLFSISQKYKITINDLLSLNPELRDSRLRRRSTILVPVFKSPEDLNLKVVENELIETELTSLDSIYIQKKRKNDELNVSVLLPFRSSEVNLDSIQEVESLFEDRNLYTIALDFYMGMVLAVERADSLGISVELNVLDSQNKKQNIGEQVQAIDWTDVKGLIGPLITSNFDYAAQLPVLKNVPMVAPLSSKKINPAENVYQSVSPLASLRTKMVEYLDKIIDTTQNVMIIADTLNAAFVKGFEEKYPFAHRVRPEEGGFVLPDLVDSLLIDSLPNKVIFESQDLNLSANVISLLNSQVSKERDVQLYTTLRTPVYEDDNISRKHLGNLRFTYLSGNYPKESESRTLFKNAYQKRFGDFPSKEAIRAYDVTLDVILRLAYKEDIYLPTIGETDYLENRFYYEKAPQSGYQNVGFYLLQHQGYDIIEIKK